MKYFSLFILILSFCGSKLHVEKSTSQEWDGGLRESGYGTDYKLTVKVEAGSDELTFEELWVGDLHLKVSITADPADLTKKTFSKGSVIIIKAGAVYRPGPDERMQLSGGDTAKHPFGHGGEGLLGYTFKGKKSYLKITDFEKLKKIIYP